MKTITCLNCSDQTPGELKVKTETYPVKGEPIEIQAEVLYCAQCDNEVFDEEYDAKNLEAAYAVYRKDHGLMAPSEIVAIRKKYGLGQRALARLLNWGEITLHRYENGAIQGAAHNEVLQLIEEPQNMRRLFEQNADALSPANRDALVRRLDQLITSDVEPAFRASLEQIVGNKDVDIISGFKSFDLGKFENMVLFFADLSGAVLKTKMNKLLWYADFLAFRERALSMSGSKYLHREFGPVPEDYQLVVGNMERERQIVIVEHVFNEARGVVGEEIRPLIKPDMTGFEPEDVEIIELLVERFRNYGSGQISDYSHNEAAYKETKEGQFISYQYAQSLSFSLSGG